MPPKHTRPPDEVIRPPRPKRIKPASARFGSASNTSPTANPLSLDTTQATDGMPTPPDNTPSSGLSARSSRKRRKTLVGTLRPSDTEGTPTPPGHSPSSGSSSREKGKRGKTLVDTLRPSDTDGTRTPAGRSPSSGSSSRKSGKTLVGTLRPSDLLHTRVAKKPNKRSPKKGLQPAKTISKRSFFSPATNDPAVKNSNSSSARSIDAYMLSRGGQITPGTSYTSLEAVRLERVVNMKAQRARQKALEDAVIKEARTTLDDKVALAINILRHW